MNNKEAIEELVNLEFYARPFDISIEASIETNNKIEAVRLAIKALDERPKGEWINPYLSSTTGEFSARCNICGEDIMTSLHHNFCPNCGAEMKRA